MFRCSKHWRTIIPRSSHLSPSNNCFTVVIYLDRISTNLHNNKIMCSRTRLLTGKVWKMNHSYFVITPILYNRGYFTLFTVVCVCGMCVRCCLHLDTFSAQIQQQMLVYMYIHNIIHVSAKPTSIYIILHNM